MNNTCRVQTLTHVIGLTELILIGCLSVRALDIPFFHVCSENDRMADMFTKSARVRSMVIFVTVFETCTI